MTMAMVGQFGIGRGYGIDNAQESGLFGLKVNSGIFANALWDVNPYL